jgi:hypothetical protein
VGAYAASLAISIVNLDFLPFFPIDDGLRTIEPTYAAIYTFLEIDHGP